MPTPGSSAAPSRPQSVEEQREKRAEAYAAKRAYEEARQHLDALAQKVFERALLDEDEMPPEAPYLEAVEAGVKHHLNALAKDNYRRSLDRTSASYDPEAKARASLDRSSRTSTAGKRRKKPRVAKDTAADVLERLVADAGGIFAFWGRDAWRSTLALEEAVAEALCPTPAPPPTPSPEKLWSLHAAELGGYAAAAPFAPFSELMKVGPWRPQTPPKPPDPLARVPPDASCSLAVFISAAQRAWLIECARVRDAPTGVRLLNSAFCAAFDVSGTPS